MEEGVFVEGAGGEEGAKGNKWLQVRRRVLRVCVDQRAVVVETRQKRRAIYLQQMMILRGAIAVAGRI